MRTSCERRNDQQQPFDTLVGRVRGEYGEMPGLRLTAAQACRLWQMDMAVCDAVLHELVAEGFLAQTEDGAYIAIPSRIAGQDNPDSRQPSPATNRHRSQVPSLLYVDCLASSGIDGQDRRRHSRPDHIQGSCRHRRSRCRHVSLRNVSRRGERDATRHAGSRCVAQERRVGPGTIRCGRRVLTLTRFRSGYPACHHNIDPSAPFRRLPPLKRN